MSEPAAIQMRATTTVKLVRRWHVLFLALLLCPANQAATLTEHMSIACVQDPPQQLQCEYRLLDDDELISSAAELEGEIVNGQHVNEYPGAQDTSEILVLVDTSDPGRQAVIEKIKQQLDGLLNALGAHHKIGLARFDTDLYVLAEIGSAPAAFTQAAAKLNANGKTTELYRNVREAVRLLGQRQAARKMLLVMSDGLAEDYAYHHEDVVELAHKHKVTVHSVGYPRSVAQSVALQTIRRLSDETGGIYAQTHHVDFSLPGGIFERILRASDSGGEIRFDLTPFIEKGAAGPLDLPLAFQTANQSFLVLAPVIFPGDALNPAPDNSAAPVDAVSPAGAPPATAMPRARPRAVPPYANNNSGLDRGWFYTLAALSLAIFIAIVFVYLRMRRNEAGKADSPTTIKALAYLVEANAQQLRHAIDKTPWRIGRGNNNDFTINDNSVSRLHAEIRSNEEGHLLLNDMESLNGVFVNDNRVDSIQLREGDVVDVGDVRMQFTFHSEDYAAEEPTVLVSTRTPV